MIKKYLVSRKPTLKKEKTFFIEERILSLSPLVKIKSITQAYKLGKNNVNYSMFINDLEINITRQTYDDLKRNVLYELDYIRYTYNFNNKIILFDIFQNSSSLMLVTVDFNSEEEISSFKKPYWLGIDVTDVEEYSFEYLIKNY